MQRALKRYLRKVVPVWVAHRIRDGIEQRLNRGPVLAISIEKTAEVLRCQVADRYAFLAPLDDEYELGFQLGTQEGRAELSGIAQGGLRGGVLFDIGAHAGLLSTLFAAARPENVVYSFEPSPLAQKKLRTIGELNGFGPRLQLQPVAIGRAKGTMEMLMDPGGAQMQVQRFEHSMWHEPEKLEVQVETIGDAAARLGVVPDFIKLDIESYEYEAIEGARDFLAQHRPELFIELHLNYLDERKLSPRTVIRTLVDCGYAFFTYGGVPLKSSAVYDSPLQTIRFVARAG